MGHIISIDEPTELPPTQAEIMAESRKEDRVEKFEEEHHLWLTWLYEAEQAVCSHPFMEFEATVGSDSASEDFFCSLCGFSQHVQYY